MPLATWKPIVPTLLKIITFRRELKHEMDDTVDDIDKLFQKTVITWKKKPDFKKQVRVKLLSIIGSVKTDNLIYFFLTRGTEGPYPIPKTGTAKLSFLSGYTPKTAPKVIGSTPGGAFGERVFATQVMHPGIEERDFDIEIKREIDKDLDDRFQKALNRGAILSGHATSRI